MSSVLQTLQSLWRGEAPAAGGLQPNVRLEGFGQQLLGEEAVILAFRDAPLGDAAPADAFDTATAAVVADGHQAMLAEHCEGRVTRVWCCGVHGRPAYFVPRVDVPFDPDLRQRRGGVLFSAGDHPELDPALADALIDMAARLAQDVMDDAALPTSAAEVPDRLAGVARLRQRVFVRRAFSTGDRIAALCAVAAWDGGDTRVCSQHNVVVLGRIAGDRIISECRIHDVAGLTSSRASTWRPRV